MATKTYKSKKKTAGSRKKGSLKNKIKSNKYSPPTIIIAVIAIISIISGIAAYAKENRSDVFAVFDTDSDVISGVDVSQHNGKIDWSDVKGNVDFAFIRVGSRGYGSGEISEDKRAKENMKAANKNDIPIGVYFYSQAINEDEACQEAEFVIDTIKSYSIDLPVVIDFEYAAESGNYTGRLYNAGLSNKERTNIINEFCSTVQDAGYIAGIYASTYVYETQINTDDLNDGTIIWVADYNQSITYIGDFDIWQYSKSGSCSGINSKSVDMNYWYLN